tara:strand:- start:2550 stop:3104 length:555 start_codon:yes stop_codon:yes gene_type:complete
MRIIAVIPAREGSKRLKHKNVYLLNGIPLIEYTINAALQSKYINKENLYVNTDFDKVIDIAKKRNIQVIERPSHLAGDKVWTQPVINHTDDELGGLDDEDIIVILQANSPQITTEKIDECIDMLINNDLFEVHTIDSTMINNGAIQVIKRKVRKQQGKVCYNGVVMADWIDVHTIEDINKIGEL